MRRILRHILPLSLRVRFLLATAAVVLVLSLSYGMVALVGYSVSFDKTTFRLCAAKAICFIPWRNGKTTESPSKCRKTLISRAQRWP
jgi:two-component system sensor histidine kinase PhoQ